ncbi:MAG: YsnF/AvaK domain-containing protein [Gemmataceae bacterium]|nr:YsnF/AvaK domain-containing protein [Gemmataceae bacterium]
MAVKTTTKRKKDNTTSQVVGTGTGVLGGAGAGAAIGSVGGPVGTAIGAVVGGLAGAFAGSAIAEAIDPSEEEAYWEKEHVKRPYVVAGVTYDEYRPAYRYGVEAANKHPDKKFEDVEKKLNRTWPATRGESSLTWSKAKPAVQDAYERTLRLHEERLNVGKEKVSTGSVSVSKEVVKEKKTVEVPVEREEVVVTRRKVGGKGGRIGEESAEIRIPVSEERVRVTKETVPVEEVTVGRRKVKGTEKIDDTVRKEKLVTKNEGATQVREESKPRR